VLVRDSHIWAILAYFDVLTRVINNRGRGGGRPVRPFLAPPLSVGLGELPDIVTGVGGGKTGACRLSV
jgi:hypothetical protein